MWVGRVSWTALVDWLVELLGEVKELLFDEGGGFFQIF